MQYEFLKQFPQRMKSVGRYSILIQNITGKKTWQQYGFRRGDEQINMVFAVLLYIMEQSLRDETCTMEEIGGYIDDINILYFKKSMSYEESKALGDFIVNVILSNEGKAMYFDGFDFSEIAYETINISYVANKIIYVDSEVKRTSYYLTEDGYNLLLSTLEIENNMQLTIHEMIFKMHLEKQSYDKAVDEMKNVFQLLHMQLQKIVEAMSKIRRNVLNYSVKDYEILLQEDMGTIDQTKRKFQDYRIHIKATVKELEEENINIRKLSKKEEEKLKNLRMIESYLNRTIEEHQKILNYHFDLKSLYGKELESLTQMSLIKRFPLRREVYDLVLTQPKALEHIEYFLRPLFNQNVEKIYNINKAVQLQKTSRKKEEESLEERLDFDEKAWEEEQEQRRIEKLKKYESSLWYLMEKAIKQGEISLLEIQKEIQNREERVRKKEQEKLIPNVEIFKEIMVELIKNRKIDLQDLRKEKSEFITDSAGDFALNEMLLGLADQKAKMKKVTAIEVTQLEDGEILCFSEVKGEDGREKNIRCSNVKIRILKDENGK